MALADTVLLRAKSGPGVGIGHVMRSRAVALEVLARGGEPILILDDAESAGLLEQEPFRVLSTDEAADWAQIPAAGAWIDGFVEWEQEIAQLNALQTPIFLVENRCAARDRCHRLVYPALHWTPDEWDKQHSERVLAGAMWIPLARELRETKRRPTRDVDLLVTFGGSDPLKLTERTLKSLESADMRVVVVVGPHMKQRRGRLLKLASEAKSIEVLEPGAALAPWISRSRMAVTALGTTLYELAFLGVPALILANYESDHGALAWYAQHGPHMPLGVSSELSGSEFDGNLRAGLARLDAQGTCEVPDLGAGAARLAEALMGAAA